MHDTIVTFTSRTLGEILETGGSQQWKVNFKHARNATYLVCARNRHGKLGDGPEAHKTGFLVGKISGLTPGSELPDRYMIRISEWAPIDMPDLWEFGRNPVRYTTLEELGIASNSLEWRVMPDRSLADTHPETPVREERLSIEQAKRGLAATFGVAVDAIEITIRA